MISISMRKYILVFFLADSWQRFKPVSLYIEYRFVGFYSVVSVFFGNRIDRITLPIKTDKTIYSEYVDLKPISSR